ncbi:glycine/sarcosine/betaine reductase complex component C subunit beta domain protein, partial [Clostridioides difficile DA00114]
TGNRNRAMIVGKGSLFLGRMTNLFDGVSFIAERNTGVTEETSGISKDEIKKIIAESMKKLALDMLEE